MVEGTTLRYMNEITQIDSKSLTLPNQYLGLTLEGP